jgi:hypothetical protein
MEGQGEQGSDLWKQEREGKANASEIDQIAGISKYGSAQDKWHQMVRRPGEQKDPSDDMEAGTANEDDIAVEAARRLGVTRMRQPRSFMHLFWHFVRASPDRLILGYESQPWLMIECKFSRWLLRRRPKASHLIQMTVQMQVLCGEYGFLACGYRAGCTKEGCWKDGQPLQVNLFQVQYSEPLWRWLLRRILIFEECKRIGRPPTLQEIPELKDAIDVYWQTGVLPAWVARMYPDIYRDNPEYLMPPQPQWRLLPRAS